MERPNDIPQDVWEYGRAVVHVYCGCAPGRSRVNGTSHHDQCWRQVEAHARAILAERERCASIADACAKEYGPKDKNDSAGWSRELSARLIKRAIMIGDHPCHIGQSRV